MKLAYIDSSVWQLCISDAVMLEVLTKPLSRDEIYEQV